MPSDPIPSDQQPTDQTPSDMDRRSLLKRFAALAIAIPVAAAAMSEMTTDAEARGRGRGKGRGKGGRFAGGVEVSGVLALVAEYGMSGRRWSNWHGGYVQRSQIPPPRFGSGRPGPEDGYVLGKAYRMLKEDLTDFAADELWTEYSIQFDRAGIFKVRG